ncbi:biopolymer transporter ExbD [Luteolibacter sp. AS25]|uniref:biopolymer transporter ExbD n=1 Tax=Luteolibacter sp. AS25 TaxID=3135776 RepID=UPI00398AA7FD
MKLETTLSERPGFLHVLPLFDLFALVTMLLLMGPMFLSQSGVTVELPASQFQLQRFRESIVVTVGPGSPEPRIHLGRQSVSVQELQEKLELLKDDENMSRAIVLLKTDAGVQVGTERMVSEMIMNTGFKLALVGTSRVGEDVGDSEAEPDE